MEMISPSLKLKTNELFFKWFTESDRNDQLKDIIHLIKTNKATKLSDLQACFKVNRVFIIRCLIYLNGNSFKDNILLNNKAGMRPKSPTIQSPPMSPVSHRMPSSPKSPRKKMQSLASMNLGQQLQQQQQQQENEQFNKQTTTSSNNKQQNKISLFSPDSVSKYFFSVFKNNGCKFQAFLFYFQ